jgi:hypothetical protein
VQVQTANLVCQWSGGLWVPVDGWVRCSDVDSVCQWLNKETWGFGESNAYEYALVGLSGCLVVSLCDHQLQVMFW